MTEPEMLAKFAQSLAKTSSSRFEASRRLMGHYRISQWSISIISALLIVIPQLGSQQNDVNSARLFSTIQSALAVVVLVYSILLSSENFFHRSKEQFRCGLEIDKLIGGINSGAISSYKSADEIYRRILEGYENHETVDYERSWYNLNKWSFSFWRRSLASSSSRLKILFGYAYYIPFALLIVALIRYLIKNGL